MQTESQVFVASRLNKSNCQFAIIWQLEVDNDKPHLASQFISAHRISAIKNYDPHQRLHFESEAAL